MNTFRTTTKVAASLAAVLALSTPAFAQDTVEASVSADVVSHYIWRGWNMDAAAVQPSLGVSYKGLSLSAWGSYGITNNETTTKEFDITLGYSTGGFNVGITDYYVVNSNDVKYFLYDAHNTAHIFEANIGYDFGPVSVQWFTNFAGADYYKADGERSYSSYVELNAPFSLGGLDWNATLGAVPFKANESSYAACANSEGFAVTNVALKAGKDIKITDSFSLPVYAQVIGNPSTQKAYFVMGFTLKP